MDVLRRGRTDQKHPPSSREEAGLFGILDKRRITAIY